MLKKISKDDSIWKKLKLYTVDEALLLTFGYVPIPRGTLLTDEEQESLPPNYHALRQIVLESIYDLVDDHDSIRFWDPYLWDVLDCDLMDDYPFSTYTELVMVKKEKWIAFLEKLEVSSEFWSVNANHTQSDLSDIFDKNNINYSTELAAAVQGWLAINEKIGDQKIKSFRHELADWLESNGYDFDFSINIEKKYPTQVARITTLCNPDIYKKNENK